MNRTIKFRAWDNVNNNMELDIHHLDTLNEYLHKDKYNVMQFTGLTDKNGKEIYEGDVIQIQDNWNYRWCSERNVIVEIPKIFARWHLYENLLVEIIGNIFQNPELLNQQP